MNKTADAQAETWVKRGTDFMKECREELSKVSRPTRQETIQVTIVTLILMFFIAISLGLMDVVFSSMMRAFV